jgi:hypothetical protein
MWLFVFFRLVGLSICGPVTKHGPLFLWLSAYEARGASCVANIVKVYSSNAKLNVSYKGDFEPQDLTDLTKS